MAIKKKESNDDIVVGKLSGTDIRTLLNKKAGQEIAFSLKDENPSEVVGWIPTGSKWLDSIICKGQYGGIPVGKISEISGLESAGKSYIAASIAANAQKAGMKIVYFDSESSVDSEFIKKLGINLEDDTYTYIQAQTVEFVFETIETLTATADNILYIWDSFANTPCKADTEDLGFDPNSSIARKARIASLGMQKLTLPIANSKSILLVLNQLKTNLDRMSLMVEPWTTPGGKALHYAYSLRIWLTGRKAKDSYIVNSKGYRIGSEIKAKIKKSRFGSEGRECGFKIAWGEDPIGIRDEESWLEALDICGAIKTGGPWKTMVAEDGTEFKFQTASWLDKLKEPKFRETVLKLMDKELIQKFNDRTGDASIHY